MPGQKVNNKAPRAKNIKFFGGAFETYNNPMGDEKERFSPHEITISDYRDKEIIDFYDYFLVEYIENEWYSFLVDYLVGLLFTDFEFTGEGAEDVYKYFNETDPNAYDEIEKMGLNVIREGTGGIKKYKKTVKSGTKIIKKIGDKILQRKKYERTRTELLQIKALNGRLIRLEEVDASDADIIENKEAFNGAKYLKVTIHGDDDWKEYIRIWGCEGIEDHKNDKIAICRLKQDPRSPYGIPFGLSSYHSIKALKLMNREILSSVFRMAANIVIADVDLSGLDTDDEKKTALENAASDYSNVVTGYSGVLAKDKSHDLYYLGTGEGGKGGRAEARLLQTMPYIEPVLSAVLMNFLMAIGIIESSNSNKSVIVKQEARARRQIKRYRKKVARFLKTHIISDITKKPVDIVFESEFEPEILLSLYKMGALSREKLLNELALTDNGKTFNKISKRVDIELNKAEMPFSVDTSNADQLTKGRKEGQVLSSDRIALHTNDRVKI